MKSMIIVALALVAVVAAAPAAPTDGEAQILDSNFDQEPNGEYTYGFETDNNISRKEVGELKEVVDEENKSHSVIVVRGSYSYIDADGQLQTIKYVSNENGYQAEGPAVPKAASR